MKYLLLFLWLVVYFNLIVSDDVSIYVLNDSTENAEIVAKQSHRDPVPVSMGLNVFKMGRVLDHRYSENSISPDSCAARTESDSLSTLTYIYPL